MRKVSTIRHIYVLCKIKKSFAKALQQSHFLDKTM